MDMFLWYAEVSWQHAISTVFCVLFCFGSFWYVFVRLGFLFGIQFCCCCFCLLVVVFYSFYIELYTFQG